MSVLLLSVVVTVASLASHATLPHDTVKLDHKRLPDGRIGIEFQHADKQFSVSLEQQSFLHPDYEVVFVEGDTVSERRQAKQTHCFYRGKVLGSVDSHAIVSLCGHASGIIVGHGHALYIEAHPHRDQLHAVYQLSDMPSTSPDISSRQAPRTVTPPRPTTRKVLADEGTLQKYIGVVLFHDAARYNKFGDSIIDSGEAIMAAIASTWNTNPANFQGGAAWETDLSVVLLGQIVFKKDPWTNIYASGTVDSSDQFTKFLDQASKSAIIPIDVDLPILLSGEASIYSGRDSPSLCIQAASVAYTTPCGGSLACEVTLVRQRIAAVLRIPSDSGVGCSSGSYFMSDPNAAATATQWSSCSVTASNAYFSGAGRYYSTSSLPTLCLDDNPPVWRAEGEDLCGDGVVTGNEQCDCGVDPIYCETQDPCCNRDTCEFYPGNVCSALDPCCDGDTCQLVTEPIECFPASEDGCTIASTCNGFTSACPGPVWSPAGTSCTDAHGVTTAQCYFGSCKSHTTQCLALVLAGDPDVELIGPCVGWLLVLGLWLLGVVDWWCGCLVAG